MSIPHRILRVMYKDTEYTAAEIAEMVNIAAFAVEGALSLMAQRGMIERRHGEKYRKTRQSGRL